MNHFMKPYFPALAALAATVSACSTALVRQPSSIPVTQAATDVVRACGRIGWADTVNGAQQDAIDGVMGSRSMRLHHALWHATRAGLSTSENQDVVHAFGPTWHEQHALCPPPGSDADAGNYNPAGEDFLYMHREMIAAVRQSLVNADQECIQGWTHVPTPQEWPLPDDDRAGPKSDAALAQLQGWDRVIQDSGWLKSHSLSQVGMALEFTVHNNLHMRYATTKPPKGFEGVEDTGGAPIPYDGRFPASWQYDDERYNWLADPYGAALNPTFWKIHGYVDHVVDLWLAANGYDSIAVDCGAKPRCYAWKGTWVGVMPTVVSAPKSPTASAPSPEEAERTREFNQRRMRHQFVGVITDADDAAKGPRKGEPGPQDPFQVAASKLCQ